MSAQSLWKRNFSYLFMSKMCKITADSLSFNTILWLLVLGGKGAIGTAFFIAVSFVPQAIVGPLITPMMKPHQLKFWMCFADLTRGAIILVIVISYFYGFTPLALVIGCMLLHSATGGSYEPASVSIIPKLVHEDLIQKANATIQSASHVVRLVTVTVCGVMIAFVGVGYTMLVIIPLYLLSALLVVIITYETEIIIDEAKKGLSYGKRLIRGFSLVRKHHILFPLAIFCVCSNFAAAPWEALSVIYLTEDLHSGPVIYSLIKVTTALGAFLMGFVLTKVKVNRYGLLFIGAGIVDGISFFITGMNAFLPLVFISAFALGAAISAVNVPEHTMIQLSVKAEDQPQVYAIINMISFFMIPLGALIGGYMATQFGSGYVIAAGGIIEAVSGICLLLFTKIGKVKRSDLTIERDKPSLNAT
ncbi:MFS transporter [Bacillus pumilus]|uniref:MFS transporter n=1 Tax=Bacillus pumilus TaxID=1408 RepID=UPI000D229CA4|nr:MFS transporter [Bacillus pumilus]AVI43116.1 MFS transporter [Bacillus pumilus]